MNYSFFVSEIYKNWEVEKIKNEEMAGKGKKEIPIP